MVSRPGWGSQNTLDLIQVDLSRPVPTGLAECLSPDELARAQSFGFDHLRRRYLTAHLALRDVLSNHLACPAADVSFVKNAWDKPSIPDGPYFSLTHSDDLAVIAVDHDHEIGVDLETGSLVLTREEMAGVLSPDELEESGERDLSEADFLRLWVRKEAVLKSLGKGTAHDPSRLTVGFHAVDFDRWREVSTVDDGDRHVFHVLDIRMGTVSCAVARRDQPLSMGPLAFRRWTPPWSSSGQEDAAIDTKSLA